MRFFNQKEEVINIELTSYGKEQFSIGEFSPAFYTFYDTSILYDGEYAQITERQNQVTNRIANETPRLRPSTRFSATPGSVFSLSSIQPGASFFQDNIWNAQFYRYLGSSDPNSSYYPSWKIDCLQQGDVGLNDGVKYLCDNTIPQMSATLHVDYVTDSPDPAGSPMFVLESSEQIVLSLEEINTLFKGRGNFDIEVFVSSSDEMNSIQFINNMFSGVDDLRLQESPQVLLDTIGGTEEIINEVFPVLNDTYAEFFLNIESDEEVSFSEGEGLVTSNYGTSITTNPQTICSDTILEES
jgi:hypothetical protein